MFALQPFYSTYFYYSSKSEELISIMTNSWKAKNYVVGIFPHFDIYSKYAL